MNKILFDFVVWLSYGFIWLLENGFVVFVKILGFIVAVLKTAVARLSIYLMQLIDETRLQEMQEEQEAQEELSKQSTELTLLQSASSVKENALKAGEWTEGHTQALQGIGNALVEECDWDEQHVYQYLKEIVESIPGLQFGVEDDDD